MKRIIKILLLALLLVSIPTKPTMAKPKQVTITKVKEPKKRTLNIYYKNDEFMAEVAISWSKKKLKNLDCDIFETYHNPFVIDINSKKTKVYYCKIRAFKEDKNGKITYGKWSKVKEIRLKGYKDDKK